MNIKLLKKQYLHSKEPSLFGRWITYQHIAPLLNRYSSKKIGSSENKIPIHQIKIGTGKKRIFIWSQMHGNESTGTKAVFDLINYLHQYRDTEAVQTILKECTLLLLPMLNPDGALAYTRVNAHQIDLNRDAVDKKAKESQLLRTVLEDFNPKFCFNLHDQRTIFGVEGTQNPATISFLAPSEEETRAITKGRQETMNVIVAMNALLQQIIPNHVGRYTDEFYPTATGDNFQKLGYNTILIEAGHYPDDYEREKTREFNFYALLEGVYHIATQQEFTDYKAYFDIPNNQKNFCDVLIQNKKDNRLTAFMYQEKVLNNTFFLLLKEDANKNPTPKLAHYTYLQRFRKKN